MAEASDTTTMTWRACPAATHPRRAIVAVAGILGIAAMLWTIGPLASIGGAILMVVMLNVFFLTSRFTIDEEGITARYPLRRLHLRWSDVRRCFVDSDGGFLSRRHRPSRWDRGMNLYFSDRRDEVVAAIYDHLPEGVA